MPKLVELVMSNVHLLMEICIALIQPSSKLVVLMVLEILVMRVITVLPMLLVELGAVLMEWI